MRESYEGISVHLLIYSFYLITNYYYYAKTSTISAPLLTKYSHSAELRRLILQSEWLVCLYATVSKTHI